MSKLGELLGFEVALRTRVNRMANEQMAMQERLMSVPERHLPAFVELMDAHASELARLANRLAEQPR